MTSQPPEFSNGKLVMGFGFQNTEEKELFRRPRFTAPFLFLYTMLSLNEERGGNLAKQKNKRTLYPRFHSDGSPCTLLSDYPDIAKEWDYHKNENPPEAYLPTSNYRAHWLCPRDHSYEANIDKRTQRGDGCPFCSGKQVLAGFNDLLTVMPELAVEWHEKKNEIFPTEVTIGSRKKVWWRCPACGNEYLAEIANRALHHSACPKCRYKRSTATRKKNQKIKSGKL